ncbi:MAG TPA: hypothetical protein VER32_09005 [Pyrinomonadaceae bacterium]|nr:hypothetical protein [Pyrinomonadaceae bacterium]
MRIRLHFISMAATLLVGVLLAGLSLKRWTAHDERPPADVRPQPAPAAARPAETPGGPASVVRAFWEHSLRGELGQANALFSTSLGEVSWKGVEPAPLAELIYREKLEIHKIECEVVKDHENDSYDEARVYVRYVNEDGRPHLERYDLVRDRGEWRIFTFALVTGQPLDARCNR